MDYIYFLYYFSIKYHYIFFRFILCMHDTYTKNKPNNKIDHRLVSFLYPQSLALLSTDHCPSSIVRWSPSLIVSHCLFATGGTPSCLSSILIQVALSLSLSISLFHSSSRVFILLFDAVESLVFVKWVNVFWFLF